MPVSPPGSQVRSAAVPAQARAGLAQARALLHSVWGYPDFRPGQRRVVAAALAGRDCLAVLPTGGGKSLCYQVPALLRPGLTLVVSPLISLMEDQVAGLRRRGVAAACLSGTQSAAVRAGVLRSLRGGQLKLLYLAPERLAQVTGESIPGGVSLLAIDEAHCISEWGHDFRPHFRALGQHRGRLGWPVTLAATATATPETRADIVRVLELRRPVVVVSSFDRPNLCLAVRACPSELARLTAAARLIRERSGSAIVYLPTRDRTDGIASILRGWGFAAAPYHAGLPGPDRQRLLVDFLADRYRVMVATNAFGMGIDKPDVRIVLHLGIPPRPEAYYQEAGRAGRDGQPADCVLLWLPKDLVLARYLALGRAGARSGSTARRQSVRAGLAAMRRYLSTRGCRRRVLLDYLGEPGVRCSGCDRCRPRA